MAENMGYGQETLKDIVEKEAGEQQQQEEDVDLTTHEHERALKGAYRSFKMPGKPKADVDSYFDQAKPYIKTLIEKQLQKMGSAKIIMTLWVIWKKSIELLVKLDPEDVRNDEELDDGNVDDIYYKKLRCHLIAWWHSFLMPVGDINDLIKRVIDCTHQETNSKPQVSWEWFYTR